MILTTFKELFRRKKKEDDSLLKKEFDKYFSDERPDGVNVDNIIHLTSADCTYDSSVYSGSSGLTSVPFSSTTTWMHHYGTGLNVMIENELRVDESTEEWRKEAEECLKPKNSRRQRGRAKFVKVDAK